MTEQLGAIRSPQSRRRPHIPEKVREHTVVLAVLGVVLCSGIAMFLPLTPIAIGVVAIVQMIALLLLRVPIAIAMLVPSFIGMYVLRGERTVTSAFSALPYNEISSWTLSVIPMFVLMGLLLWKSGFTGSIFNVARVWLSWMPGGLAVGTNLAGAGLAAVSGSTISTTHAIGRMSIPEMLRAGYDKRLAIGAVIASGLPGQLIPPSILLVLYAGIAEVPVGAQLLAGVLPGILVAILFSLMIVFLAKFVPSMTTASDDAATPRTLWRERFASLLSVWPLPLIILIIVGGMFSGYFTATEAGAVAALCSVAVLLVWKRGSGDTLRSLADGCVTAISSAGTVFLLLVGVAALSRLMTLTGISTRFADLITDLGLDRIQFLLIMLVLYLVLGAFMDPLPMMLLTVPVLIPTLTALDISLIWYGVFVVFMGELAMITPPIGVLSMIVHSISRDPEVNLGRHIGLKDVFVAVAIFMPMAIIMALLLIFFPDIATFLADRSTGGG